MNENKELNPNINHKFKSIIEKFINNEELTKEEEDLLSRLSTQEIANYVNLIKSRKIDTERMNIDQGPDSTSFKR